MHRGLSDIDHASFFSEATLIEIGVYKYLESLPDTSSQIFD